MILKEGPDRTFSGSSDSTSPPAFSPELSMASGAFAPPAYAEAVNALDRGSPGVGTLNVSGANIPAERAHLYSRPAQEESLDWSGLRDVVTLEVLKPNERDIISHDPALEDPDLLDEWLRYQASKPPTFKLRCSGTHKEMRTHDTMHMQSNGKAKSHESSKEETVTDFDFFIDLTRLLPAMSEGTHTAIVLSTVSPSEPAYRGSQERSSHPALAPPSPHRDGSKPTPSVSASTSHGPSMFKKDLKRWKKWAEHRSAKGLPAWKEITPEFEDGLQKGKGKATAGNDRSRGPLARRVHRARHAEGFIALGDEDPNEDGTRGTSGADSLPTASDTFASDPERSAFPPTSAAESTAPQATIREWVEAYCCSSKPLKEFLMTKEVWGWDLEGLGIAIKGLIASTGYVGEVRLVFGIGESVVSVKPDNWYSRLTSQGSFVTFLLCITLVYPALLLYKRFRGGAKFQTVRASYALKCYVPDRTQPTKPLPVPVYPYDKPADNTHPVIPEPSTNGYRFHGEKEGVFMRKWENAIKGGVIARYRGDLAKAGMGVAQGGRTTLDGYYD